MACATPRIAGQVCGSDPTKFQPGWMVSGASSSSLKPAARMNTPATRPAWRSRARRFGCAWKITQPTIQTASGTSP